MKAFISYSHQDKKYLDILHKHLAQLKRDGLLSTWTDQEIDVGNSLNSSIDSALQSSALFIALISPDYISSNYCYEKEFQAALKLHDDKKIIIIPIIVEPCEWLSTPFKKFMAAPKDGKAVSTWDNPNTAFLDVVLSIRRLLTNSVLQDISIRETLEPSRNYRVQKDFDSIEKIEFAEKSFGEVKNFLKRFVNEIIQLDNIKSRLISDNEQEFSCLLVNRNKIATEAHMLVNLKNGTDSFSRSSLKEKNITYSIANINRSNNNAVKAFVLDKDEYRLFWTEGNIFRSSNVKEFTSRDIANTIWNEALETIGIF